MTIDFAKNDSQARNISNSEVTAFLSCKRQYEFAFIENLQPKETSLPLSRGTTFHLGMENYWKRRLAGEPHAKAFTFAAEETFSVIPEGFTLEAVMEAQFLWTRYMEFHQGFPDIEPLGTENQISLPLTPTLNTVIKYDFYFRKISTNKYAIMDYKTSYDFWQPEDHDLNGQMPKYIAVMQANGIRVDEGYIEEIRTRKLGAEKSREAKNLWRTTRYVPSAARKQSVLQQHIGASLQIEEFRALAAEDRAKEALPVLNKHGACKYCNFKSLCISLIEGKKDLSVDIRVGFEPNMYGYNNENEVTSVNF